MSLTVEDGTGLSTAEALVSVAYCDSYHAKRGNSAWAAISVVGKEWAIRKAADYMTQKYRLAWQGYRVNSTQGQDWPRSSVYREDSGTWVETTTVPDEVKKAQAELALRALNSELNPDQERATVKEVIGPIEVTYDAFSPQGTVFSAAHNLLAPYLKHGSGINARLVR